MKLSELMGARKVIAKISAEQKLPFAVAYKITKFFKETDSDEEFYNSKVSGLVTEYGTKDDEGNTMIPKEKVAEVEGLLKELADTEVNPSIKFSESEFASLEISIQDCAALYPLIGE